MADNLNSIPSHPEADSYATVAEADAYFKNRSGVENWETLTNDKKESILKLATKHIDSLRFFGKKLYEEAQNYRLEQALEFPRSSVEAKTGKPDSVGDDYFIDSSLAGVSTMPSDFFNGGAVIITDGTGKGQTLKIEDFDADTGKVSLSEDWGTKPDEDSRYLIIASIPKVVKYAVFEQSLYILNGGGERQRLQSEGVVEFRLDDLSEKFKESAVGGKIPLSNEAKGYLHGYYTIGGQITV